MQRSNKSQQQRTFVEVVGIFLIRQRYSDAVTKWISRQQHRIFWEAFVSPVLIFNIVDQVVICLIGQS